MRILIAPDKFKDALDAAAAAAAMAEGVRSACPDAALDLCPLGDGGEGTGRILAAALGAEQRTAEVLDPRGRVRVAHWWRARGAARGALAMVEMAEASGLVLLAAVERDPLETTSYGTGQLVREAIRAGCTRVLLCVGGSATVDGGAGCLQALGFELQRSDGTRIPPPITGGQLSDIAALIPPAERPRVTLDVLTDVDNPLLGRHGAARVYGPQKGADRRGVARLERGLRDWAAVLRRDCGRDVRRLRGAGAAGGLPAGLIAALGARRRVGFAEVARHLRLRKRLAGCDLCLTGEGRLDAQTVHGKVVSGLGRMARAAGVPAFALVGAVELPPGGHVAQLAQRLGLTRVWVITPEGTARGPALAATADNLRRAAAEVVNTWQVAAAQQRA